MANAAPAVSARKVGHRLAGADLIRALGTMAIFTFHTVQCLKPGPLSPLLMLSFFFGGFFVLAGYLLARPFWLALDRDGKLPSLRVYALRRAARIAPAFWLALTVSFVLSWTLFGKTLDRILIIRYLTGMSFVSELHWITLYPVYDNMPLWSIGVEVTSYILLALCLIGLFKTRLTGWPARLLWLGLIVALTVAQWQFVVHVQINDLEPGLTTVENFEAKGVMTRYSPLAFFAMTALGALASGVHTMLRDRRSPAFDVLVIVGIVLGWCIAEHYYPSEAGFGMAGILFGFPWFQLSIALILVAIPGSVVVSKFSDCRPVTFISTYSFGIYLWHHLIMSIINQLWVKNYYLHGMVSMGAWALTTTCILVSTLIAAAASYHLLEAPVVRWARSLEPRKG